MEQKTVRIHINRDFANRVRAFTFAWLLIQFSLVPMFQQNCAAESFSEVSEGGALVTAPVLAPLVIRPARKEDLKAAAEIERACFDPAICFKPSQFLYLQKPRETTLFLVAERNGEILGEVIGVLRRSPKGGTGRVYSLAVSARARGQGLGKKLMLSLTDQLRARGAKNIYLEVEAINEHAVALYGKMGFGVSKQLLNYYGESKHGLSMVQSTSMTASQGAAGGCLAGRSLAHSVAGVGP